MALRYDNLDELTRVLMLEEIDNDLKDQTIYRSPRLSPRGLDDWANLLLEAARTGSDATLANDLQRYGRINPTEQRTKRGGGFTTVKVGANAHEMLAEGEFNRFYMRAMCRRSMDEHRALEVYRAKAVSSPRPESELKIGSLVEAPAVLRDLRERKGLEPTLGLPTGPNSGLSVRFPPG